MFYLRSQDLHTVVETERGTDWAVENNGKSEPCESLSDAQEKAGELHDLLVEMGEDSPITITAQVSASVPRYSLVTVEPYILRYDEKFDS